MKTILLFPGQGAQKVGMARDIADAFPAAHAALQAIDTALGTSLTSLMWESDRSHVVL